MRIILQNNDQDCLLACYAMILSHYGIHVSLVDLYEQEMIPPDGLSVSYLKQLNHQYGLEMKVYKAPLKSVIAFQKQTKGPVIAQWNENHFIVIQKVKPKKIHILDPALGALELSHEHFQQHYTHYLVAFKPSKVCPVVKQQDQSQRSLMSLFFNQGLVLILISLLVSQVVVMAFSMSIRHTLGGNATWYTSALIFLLLCLLQLTSYWLRWTGLKKSNEFYEGQLAKQMFQGLFSRPLLFFRNQTTGALMEKIQLKSTIRDSLLFQVVPAFINFFSLLVLLIYLLFLSIPLSALILVLLMAYASVNYWLYQKQRNANIEYLQNNIQLSAQMQEDLTHIDEIKALNEEEVTVENWSETNHQLQRSYQALIKVESLLESVSQMFNFACLLLVLWMGMLLVDQGRLTFADLILFQTGISLFTGFIGQVQQAIFEWVKIKIYREKQTDILTQKRRKKDVIHPESQAAISFKHVSYGYQPHQSLFNDVTFDIQKGEKVAILGASGSGKSTLFNLLLGLYEHQGEISYGIADLRNKMGVVLQGMTLKKGTLYDNLIQAPVEAVDFNQLQRTLRQVKMEQVVEQLPKGLFSHVFQGGKNLSGGQIQRLLMAKSLFNNNELIFWDEAFSSLDNQSRTHIYEHVLKNKQYQAHTMIMISHHVDVVHYVDKIIFLDAQTHQVYVDTHPNLWAQCSSYQHFLRRV